MDRSFYWIILSLSTLLGLSCGQSNSSTSMKVKQSEQYYTEPHRLQYHFSPDSMWMNDPNGMVFHEGEYHLFYQYYPDSTVWGPMHWGHAVSEDLVHWEHLPIGLFPDSLGYIFSGSAVVDAHNTSGLGSDEQPPMVAIFTYHDPEKEKTGAIDFQTQGIAYSLDKGRSWTKYEGNPVIPNPGIRDFRDPKVFWHEATARWCMIFAAKDRVRIYHSPNLIDWTLGSEFGENIGAHGGVWECPDLFELPVDGTGQRRWVMLLSINPGGPNGGSATQYFVGDFDGETFRLDPDFAGQMPTADFDSTFWVDYGRDNYAGVTWSNIPEEDGRRIFIGWMSNWDYATIVPTSSWRSAMTLPRTLHLISTSQGLRLASRPVAELTQIRGNETSIPLQVVSGTRSLTSQFSGDPSRMELIATWQLPDGDSAKMGFRWKNALGEVYEIGYDQASNQFYSDRREAGKNAFSDRFASQIHVAPRWEEGKTLTMHLFVDVASGELFADDGLSVMTDIFFPHEPFSEWEVFSTDEVALPSLKCYPLQRIWADQRTP